MIVTEWDTDWTKCIIIWLILIAMSMSKKVRWLSKTRNQWKCKRRLFMSKLTITVTITVSTFATVKCDDKYVGINRFNTLSLKWGFCRNHIHKDVRRSLLLVIDYWTRLQYRARTILVYQSLLRPNKFSNLSDDACYTWGLHDFQYFGKERGWPGKSV